MRLDKLIEKYTCGLKKKKKTITEASSVMSWSFWNKRSPLIYVQNGNILWANTWEFPVGMEMTDDVRKNAAERGYTILDM